MIDIEQVLRQKQMVPFLIGAGEFHIKPGPEIDEPTNYNRCWRQFIVPFLTDAAEADRALFAQQFVEAINKLCNYQSDYGLGLYTVFAHLQEYFYIVKSTPELLLPINWSLLIPEIRSSVTLHRAMLTEDKRWAGVDWNTEGYAVRGIFGVLRHTSEVIADRYGQVRLL